jgi:chemotaxis protein CheZ
MTSSGPPSNSRDSAYGAIEAALTGSERGRRFLAEYARRSRGADTQALLDAIASLQASLALPPAEPRPGQDSDALRRELIDMSEAIAQTRREIAAIKPPGGADSRIVTATGQLDAIVEATERATGDILNAAEALQELSMELREKGLRQPYCDRLDSLSTDIFTACSFQDITGQRTTKVVEALAFLEKRVNAMVGIWGVEEIAFRDADIMAEPDRDDGLLNGPQDDAHALRQHDIDSMLSQIEADENDIAFGAGIRVDDLLFEPAYIESVDEAAMPARAEPQGERAKGDATDSPQVAPGPAKQDEASVVDEDLFGQPEDLSLWSLDTTRRNALFG